jgi:hypothetical protein
MKERTQALVWRRDETTLLAGALINPAPPSVRQVDGIAAPTIPIRSVAYNESSAAVPAWLSGPHARPRVYLTLGTVSFGAVGVLSRAIAEIAPLGVDILVTVGPEGEPAALGDVPDNVHVERFVAQSAVLPSRRDRNGPGSARGGLAATPAAARSRSVLQRTDLDRGRSGPCSGERRTAAQALLGNSPERDAAARLQDEIAAMPSPTEAVSQLVELAG